MSSTREKEIYEVLTYYHTVLKDEERAYLYRLHQWTEGGE